MTQKHTSATDASTPINVVLVTLDNHVNGAIVRAEKRLVHDLPGIHFRSFAATEWEGDEKSLIECREAIAEGDIIIVTMLFMEPHINAVSDALAARRDHCDALICCMSAPEVMQYTRMGRFTMDSEPSGPIAAQASARNPERRQARSYGRAPVGDAATSTAYSPVHSRYCTRRSHLFLDTTVLVGRL